MYMAVEVSHGALVWGLALGLGPGLAASVGTSLKMGFPEDF